MKSRLFGSKARGAVALVLVAGAVPMISACGSSASGQGGSRGSGGSSKHVLIGTIDGTTGAYGATGININQGVAVAVDYLNSHGGILGRKVTYTNLNDNASATLAAQEFQRLVSAGAVVINGSSDTGPATAAEAQRAQIPDVGIVDDGGPTIYSHGPSGPPNPWAYEFSINNYAMGEIFAKYALAHCPGGKLALLHDSTSYGVGASQAESAVYAAAHRQLSVDDQITENWSSGATVGLTSEINKVKSSGAQCVDVWLTPQDSAAFLKEASSLGNHFTILGNDEYYATNTFGQLAGKLADGVISAEQTTALHPNKMTKLFTNLFDAKYHPSKGYNTTYAQATFDALLMVAQVINQAKSTSPSDIQAGLDKTKNFLGATGNLSFSKQQHESITAAQMSLIKYDAATNKWVPLNG